MLALMEIISFLVFATLIAILAPLIGVDSRDGRRPSERIGALQPLR
jgi:hypothetical protein